MTENEKIIEEANEIAKGRMYATNEVIRLQKELEQYRAIGTVEKIKEELDRLRNDNECQGLYFTLEERKALAKQSRELSEYKGIGTVDEFKALKEKVEPKKPLPKGTHKGIDNFYCPNCNHPLTNRHEQCELPYCDICGQKLDWSE